MKNFIDIDLNEKTLDIYYIRNSIFRELKQSCGVFKGEFLDVGCGKMPYKNYILEHSQVESYTGLDIDTALVYDSEVKPDETWNGIIMPFADESYDCAMATEVLEHCPEPNVVLKEIHRVLRPGSHFFFTVPFLWNLHEVPYDEYRYTPFSMQRHLEHCGFDVIDLKATGGWHASMAQMLGLWVRRSPMSKTKKKWLSKLLKPIIKYLIKMDKPDRVVFKEGQMITGLSGIAIKR